MKSKTTRTETNYLKTISRRSSNSCATTLLLVLLILPTAMQAQYTYTTNNNTITITGYTGPGGDVTIPDTINGLPVAAIGDQAFQSKTSLNTITIPGSVTSIGNSVFYLCTKVSSITIGNGVTNIGNYAFFYCSNLAGITLPGSVTSIGANAFARCASLASVAIPASVTSIGASPFANCSKLLAITVAAANSSYSSLDGVLFDKNQTTIIQFPQGKGGSYPIPGSVTNIAGWTFYNCKKISSATIPDSATSIGTSAFDSCTGMSSVTIGNGVTSIEDSAFSECTSLTAITVDGLSPAYSSVDGVLFDKNQTTLIKCPGGKAGSYTIPSSVYCIGGSAFAYCPSLSSVVIPNSVTTIGDSAFYYCISLTSVTMPNSVTTIGGWAFFNCWILTSATIGNGVTNIGERAFSFCTNLTAITVGTLNSAYSSVGGVLFNKTQTKLIQYPGHQAGSYTIPNGVTSIVDYAFAGCNILKGVIMPNSVTNLGSYAFAYTQTLREVYFQGNAPSHGSYVFFNKYGTTVYYLSETTGWGSTFDGRPTVLWNPQVDTSDASFGVQSNQFGFTITGTSNLVVVVEAGANLANPIWSPVGTNALISGSSYFSDPQWTNYPARFYRLRSP